MKEIGGYIELDTYTRTMLHEDGVLLNCGRNALAYLLQAKKIKKILMPKFMCDSCDQVLKENEVNVEYYSIGLDFKPHISKRTKLDWLYVVNFYGQLTNDYIKSLGENVIVDNAQAYFQDPIPNFDTIYTCRKFFGVADGAILYTDKRINIKEQDLSFDRMHFLLGRYEKTASEFYDEYVYNNSLFHNEPLKKMSRLTQNLLNGIDYDYVKRRRTNNFIYLDNQLKKINRLKLIIPEGPFMYPLFINNGAEIRKKLQKKNIYIPILWPSVLKNCNKDDLEYDLANNILPLPVDQRYDIQDMEYMVKEVLKCIN